MSVNEMKKMKTLMENYAASDMAGTDMAPPMDDMPADDMAVDDMPADDMAADDMAMMDGGDAAVIDELDAEFKRITTEYLQVAGPLDAPEHAEMRKKLCDHMKKILDELHDGWMDDMMGTEGAHDAPDVDDDSKKDSDTPEFFGGTDDDDDDDSDDKDDSEDYAKDDDSDDDSDDKNDDSDDKNDDDDKEPAYEESNNNPHQFNESKDSATNMRKLMESIK